MSSSNPSNPSILLIGAGELGTAVLDALAKHPQHQHATKNKISVLLRQQQRSSGSPEDPAKQRTIEHIKSLGADIETGDIVHDAVASLAATFRNYDVVLHCAGYGFPRGTYLRVAQAAVESGVRRFFPFQFGMDYDAIGEGNSEGLFDEMIEVRRLLLREESEGNGMGWTIVSTGLFVSYLFLPGFGVVDLERRVVRALGSWENAITVSTLEGIGKMVAELVFEPGDSRNRVVYVGGDTISYRRLAGLVEAVWGGGDGDGDDRRGSFRRELWDEAGLRRMMEENPDDLFARYRVVFGKGVGVSWDMDKTLNYQRGMTLMDVEAFARENKERIERQT